MTCIAVAVNHRVADAQQKCCKLFFLFRPAAGYSAHKKAQSRPGFGLLRASVLTSNREEKQLVL